jgi:hypothetical protein
MFGGEVLMATQEAIQEMLGWQKRLHKMSLDEALAVLGQPAREFGPRREKREYTDGTSKSIDYIRGFEFDGVGKTFRVLRVDERSDGRLQLSFLPRATTSGEQKAEPSDGANGALGAHRSSS